jgi:hypothetical protein
MMSQSGCMAIEDAAVQAQLLQSSETIDAAPNAYELRRRPRVDWVQRQSEALGRSAPLRTPCGTRSCGSRERSNSRPGTGRSFPRCKIFAQSSDFFGEQKSLTRNVRSGRTPSLPWWPLYARYPARSRRSANARAPPEAESLVMQLAVNFNANE